MNAYQRDQIRRATDSYGTFNDGKHDNVVVGFVENNSDASTAYLGLDGNIHVKLNFEQQDRDPVVTIAHEGSHVADFQDYLANRNSPNAAAYDIPLYMGENRAYLVSSYMAQALGKDSYYPNQHRGTRVWDKGWKEHEREVKRRLGVYRFNNNGNVTTPLSQLPRY